MPLNLRQLVLSVQVMNTQVDKFLKYADSSASVNITKLFVFGTEEYCNAEIVLFRMWSPSVEGHFIEKGGDIEGK